jgi:hypothetical protein
MPVMNQKVMMGVISLYDVAKAVVDSQNLKTRCSRSHPRTGLETEDGSRD